MASVVTVPTPEIAADESWAQSGASPVVTPYGFPEPQRRSPAETRQPRSLRLIFGGALSYRKGSDRLAELLGVRPGDVESFDVFGSTAAFGRSVRLPAWWDVHRTVPRCQWLDALRRSHVLVLPSREEGMARVGQEALACGVPVIATPEAGLGVWLRQGAGVELRAEEWRAGFESALADMRAAWTTYSESALAIASSWSWDEHADLLLRQVREARTHA